MKMIWAVVRPEHAEDIIDTLRTAGIHTVTSIGVSGFFDPPDGTADRPAGRLLMTAVADHDVPKAVLAIRETAKAHGKDSAGSDMTPYGKIIVSYVDDSYTIRPARKGRDGPA